MTTSPLSPTLKTTSSTELITVAAGCFWGVENVLKKQFKHRGLVDIVVGYANGIPSIDDVTYEKVCKGNTDFVEAVQIAYEPEQVSAKEILEIFFIMHDPTTVDSQGPDKGSQYRSAVLTHSQDQNRVAAEVRDAVQKKWYPNHKIQTSIEPIQIWWDAEDYHQEYLDKNPGGYECPSHFIRTSPKV